jgi:thiamine biosynthesis lipoprotein
MDNYTVSFQAMGSRIQAWLSVTNADDAQILGSVPDWFEEWEACFSRFRKDSELSRLNRRAGHWMKVSQPLLEVISAAVQGAQTTNGLFNPLILQALQAVGYGHSFEPENFIPDQATRSASIADFHQIEIDPAHSLVRLPRDSQIDLGGIAKGWSAQQTANRLSNIGPCLVDAGGDMAAIGSPDETGGWFVSVPNPVTSQFEVTVLLKDAAIATSGTDYRHWTRDGQALHHIIDPRTGQPAASDVLSATVVAPDAVSVEVWAKTALIGEVTSHYPTLLFRHDGSTVYNQEFEALCTSKVR